MSFTLRIDTARWRRSLQRFTADVPGVVPVAKGNGYGFGLDRLGREADRLAARTIAVGLPHEAPAVSDVPRDVLVLQPWRPGQPDRGEHVIRTVSHLDALEALAGSAARVVIEIRTSMQRHGLQLAELPRAVALLSGVTCEGVALHLPLVGDRLGEAMALLDAASSAGLPDEQVWVSHLTPGEVAVLQSQRAGRRVRLRAGTALWLGDPGATRAVSQVLDVHPLARGDRYGYRQRRALADGHLLVVSGGTAHGVALEAPVAVSSLRDRARVLALAGLEAGGYALSPFEVAGRRRVFAEPPHMQVSLVLLPASVPPPAIGDELATTVRMTTVTFDEVEDLGER